MCPLVLTAFGDFILRPSAFNACSSVCSRHAARQRRTRFLVNAVAGAVFSIWALGSLKVAASSEGPLPVPHGVVQASMRLSLAPAEVGMAAGAITYAALSGVSPKAPVDVVEAPETELAAPEVVTEVIAEADVKKAALDAIEQWANAWRRRDVDGYLAAYGDGFQPANGLDREAWNRHRRQRIGEKREIQLVLNNIEVEVDTPERVRIKFVQDYRADQFIERGTEKALVLVLEHSHWRIQREESRH